MSDSPTQTANVSAKYGALGWRDTRIDSLEGLAYTDYIHYNGEGTDGRRTVTSLKLLRKGYGCNGECSDGRV